MRLRRFTARDLRLLMEAQIALFACEVARRRRPTGKLVTLSGEDASRPAPVQMSTATAVGWAVDRASRYGAFRPSCLVRSLAIQRMLRRRCVSAGELRIGFRGEGESLVAHAWVEVEGVVIGDAVQHVRTFTPAPALRLVEL